MSATSNSRHSNSILNLEIQKYKKLIAYMSGRINMLILKCNRFVHIRTFSTCEINS